MPRQIPRKYNYLQNPIVDDYNIRDENFWRQVDKMKHISAYTNLHNYWTKHFAWWPTRSDHSGKFIWLTSYWEYAITMDMHGKVPLKGDAWRMIYTREEYILKKLTNNE